MTLAEQGYRSRLMDVRIGEMLESFGAVSIEGPKYCGKTWTALSNANSAVYVMDPEGGFANRRLAQVNPGRLLEGDGPRLMMSGRLRRGFGMPCALLLTNAALTDNLFLPVPSFRPGRMICTRVRDALRG